MNTLKNQNETKLKKAVAVFGYNNTRLYDVLKIRKIVADRTGAALVLIKEGITPVDQDVTPYCFDYAPEDPTIGEFLEPYIIHQGLELIGCLPFSDKGVIGAAYAARHFNLPGDEWETAKAMLDKSLFRILELGIEVDLAQYKKPFFITCDSEEKLRKTLTSSGPFFIKPTSEGNSRGCMKIESESDLNQWLSENPNALQSSVICEEILSQSHEYSFDGIAGAYWITQKFTTAGAYRAEYQQIVPAPFNANRSAELHSVLQPLLTKLGSRGGAFHHEFFVLGDERVAGFEPNRRPAGMWIWDLATWAFKDFNPWERWVDFCTNRSTPPVALSQDGFTGVRGVIANQSGKLGAIPKVAIQEALRHQFGDPNIRISFLKESGNAVRSEPRDNSDFLALIAIKDSDYETLLKKLESAERLFLNHIEVSPCV